MDPNKLFKSQDIFEDQFRKMLENTAAPVEQRIGHMRTLQRRLVWVITGKKVPVEGSSVQTALSQPLFVR